MNEGYEGAGCGRDDWRWLLLIFVGFVAVTSLVYGGFLYDCPKRDHLSVIAERGFVDSDWDWFVHVKSLSRARFHAQGDHYTFRPLTLAVMAIEDIGLRENRAAIGFISFVFHAFAGFCCYRLLSLVLPRFWAILAASAYLIQFTGVELVVWRHISGYLLAPAFLAIGLRRLLLGRSGRCCTPVTAAALLAASLFHEIAFVTECLLLLAVAFTYFRQRPAPDGPPSTIDWRPWLQPLLAAVVLYLLLNAADYAWYRPGSLFHRVDRRLSWSSMIEVLRYSAALAAASLTGPWLTTTMTTSEMLGIPLRGVASPWLGGVLIAGLFSAAAWCLRNLRRGRDQVMNSIALTSTFGLFALAFGVGLLRGAMRGIEYLEAATYYYGMANFFISLLLGWGLYALRSCPAPVRRIGTTAMLGYLVVLGAGNTLRVQSLARSQNPDRARLAHEVIRAANDFFTSHPEYAYGGTLPPLEADEYDCLAWSKATWVDLALARHARSAHTGTPRLYLHGMDDDAYLGTIAVQQPTPGGRREPVGFQLQNTRFVQTAEGLLSEHPAAEFKEGTGFVVSDPADQLVELDLRISNTGAGGVLFDYRGEQAYGMLVFRESRWYWQVMRDGRLSPPMSFNLIPQDRPAVQVRLLRTGRWMLAFVDDFLITCLPAEDLPPGKSKVGLYYDSARPAQRMAFSDIYRTTSSGTCAVRIGFTPICRLGRITRDRLLTK